MALQPISQELTIASNSTYSNNLVNIVGSYGGKASFAQINNFSATDNVKVQLNGGAIITVPAQSSQVFANSGFEFSTLAFANSSGDSIAIELILGIEFGSV